MVQQPTFASRDTARLDLPTKPLVVLHRSTEQLQCDLISIAAGFDGNLIQPGFKFGRDVQVHRAEGRGEGEGLSTLGRETTEGTMAFRNADQTSRCAGSCGVPGDALLPRTSSHLRCRLANAPPEPDFRYFSNATARPSSENSTITSMIQGLASAVWGTRPALCAASRAEIDRKSTRLNSSHERRSRMPSSA